jgi:hypothetical protein
MSAVIVGSAEAAVGVAAAPSVVDLSIAVLLMSLRLPG